MKLNFKEEKYKKIAMESKGYSYSRSEHTISDAFMLLLKGVKEQDLSNLCLKMQKDLESKGKSISIDKCYNIIQGNFGNSNLKTEEISSVAQKKLGKYILELAYDCISEIDENGKQKHLGNNVIANGTINTSSWITHSLYESQVAQMLAEMLGVNKEKAGVLALLHDYGRKYTHDFSHVTRGFEALVDERWIEEARATLTHSFINGGRCANCDPAEDGFYIDENGEPKWEDGTEKDDITDVLENLQYDDYDMILNIADLMATDRGITSPYDRVQDVATRKKIDVRNRGYFLSEFTNKLIYVMESLNCYSEDKISPLEDLDKINLKFQKVSKKFYEMFLRKRTNSISEVVTQVIVDVIPSEIEDNNLLKTNENGEELDR